MEKENGITFIAAGAGAIRDEGCASPLGVRACVPPAGRLQEFADHLTELKNSFSNGHTILQSFGKCLPRARLGLRHHLLGSWA